MSRCIYVMRGRIKAQISLRTSGVTKKDTLLGSVIKLMTGIRSKMRVTITPKDLELGKIWGSSI